MIELIIIIVLIGIFTTMALTRTETGLTTIKEQIAIDQITNDIDLARSMAFARNENIIIIKYRIAIIILVPIIMIILIIIISIVIVIIYYHYYHYHCYRNWHY